MTWDVALGYFTGLRLLGPNLDGATLVRTVLVVHTCDAVMCRVIAANNGYGKRLWTVLGFFLGVWAVAVLLLLPRRNAVPASDSATSPSMQPGSSPAQSAGERRDP